MSAALPSPTVIRTFDRDGITVDVIAEPDSRNGVVYFNCSWASASKPGKRNGNGTSSWKEVVRWRSLYGDRDFRCQQKAIAGWM